MKNITSVFVLAMVVMAFTPDFVLSENWPSLEKYVEECVLIVKCKTEKKAKFQYRVLETWKGEYSSDLFLFYDTPSEGCLFAHQNHGNDRPRNGREVIFFFTKRNQPVFAGGKLEHHSACFNIEDGKVIYAENSDFDEKEYTVDAFKKAIASANDDQRTKKELHAGARTADPVLISLQSKLKRELRDLLDGVRFEVPESSAGNSLLMRYQTREYQVYTRNKAGQLSRELVQREGPDDEGVLLSIHVQPKGDVNQAMVPQTIQEPYWSTFLNVYSVADSDKQIYMALASTSRTDKKLTNTIISAVAAVSLDKVEEWSQPVNGLVARLQVLPAEKPDSPFCRVLIEMQNVDDVAGQKRIRFDPDRLELHVIDSEGKQLPKASGPYDGETPFWEPTLLPYFGTMKFQISFPGLGYHPATDKVIIDVGSTNAWIIPQDGLTYWLSGKLQIDQQKGDHRHMDWNGTLELPKVRIPREKQN